MRRLLLFVVAVLVVGSCSSGIGGVESLGER